jgi:hypothetical protein
VLSFGGLKELSAIQQALVFGLLLVSILTIYYVDISWTFKLGIGVLTFALIFLVISATALLRQQKEIRKAQS